MSRWLLPICVFSTIATAELAAGRGWGADAPVAAPFASNAAVAAIAQTVAPPFGGARDGETLFRKICAGCHMSDGRGAVGAGRYPALAGDPRLEDARYPLYLVANGQGAMPGFAALLDRDQMLAVVNYLRSHFGNQYPPATLNLEVGEQ